MAKSVLMPIIYGAVGLMIAFIVFGAVVMPEFSKAWRYCQALSWEGATGGVYTNCSDRYQDEFNTTFVDVTAGSHTENGITSPIGSDNTGSSSYCLNCKTTGGYRTTVQGLTLLTLSIGVIAIGARYII